MTGRATPDRLLHSGCRYYLAELAGPMRVRLIDGCHGSPEGVAKAAKLHNRIFGSAGPFVMVEITPIPNIDVPINQAAAATCREAVEKATQ